MRLLIMALMFFPTQGMAQAQQGWRMAHPIDQTLPLQVGPVLRPLPTLPVLPPLSVPLPQKDKDKGFSYSNGRWHFAEPPSPPGFSSPGRGVKR